MPLLCWAPCSLMLRKPSKASGFVLAADDVLCNNITCLCSRHAAISSAMPLEYYSVNAELEEAKTQ